MELQCKTCGVLVIKNDFYKGPTCRKCYLRLWNRTNERRFIRASYQATKRGKTFDLTFEEFDSIVSKPCYYCDNKLYKVTVGVGLDRVNNKLGYSASNVVPCCKICNRLKNDFFTMEETKAAVQSIIKIRFKSGATL